MQCRPAGLGEGIRLKPVELSVHLCLSLFPPHSLYLYLLILNCFSCSSHVCLQKEEGGNGGVSAAEGEIGK